MGQRTDFGASWSDIITKYYFGKSPLISGELAWEALGVVERLCPEFLDKILAMNAEGPSIIAQVIDRGFTLKACEKLGFKVLLEKIKRGDTAALSEAEFAAELVKLNYRLEYEPTNGIGKKPDFRILVGDKEVYAEVISPNLSEEMKQAYNEMWEIANKTVEQNPGKSVDIVLSDSNPDTSTYEESPILAVAGFKMEGNLLTGVNVRLQLSDDRARKLLEKETKHFAQNEINFVVMNVSYVPDGIKGWVPLIKRSLQPGINRRIGAVVLFESRLNNEMILRRWCILKNPYAYCPVPEALLNDIGHLNDSMQLADL